MHPEHDNNLTGEKSIDGEPLGRNCRDAGMGGWFDAQMLRLAGTP